MSDVEILPGIENYKEDNHNLQSRQASTENNISLENENNEEKLKFLQNQITEKENKIKDLDLMIEEKFLTLSKFQNIDVQLISKEFVYKILDKKNSNKHDFYMEENNDIIQPYDSQKISQLEEVIMQLNKEKQEFIFQISKLNQEKTMLEEKVMKMKQAIMDIKSKLDTELNKKFEKKELELRDTKFQMALLEKKLESMNKEVLRLKKFEDHTKAIRAKYNQSLMEKMELEDVILQQDERINDLSCQMTMVEEALNRKSDDLKSSEQNCITLMKLIEDQKRNIKTLQIKLKKKDDEENQRKLFVAEKEQEVHFLKNFINSLKNESSLKEQNLSSVKNKLEKAKNENKQLTSVIQSTELKKKNLIHISSQKNLHEIKSDRYDKYINIKSEKMLIPSKSQSISPIVKKQKHVIPSENNFGSYINDLDNNEINDENLKEITILMKKILEE